MANMAAHYGSIEESRGKVLAAQAPDIDDRLRRWQLPYTMSLAIMFSIVSLAVLATSTNSELTFNVFDVFTWTYADPTVWDFTLVRKGYNVLPFFDDDASDIITYKFLENYNGIIEPFADMDLEIISDSTVGTHYHYKVYNISGSEIAHGSYSYTSNVTESINVGCKPYDKLTVEVTKYYEGKSVSSDSADFLCLYVRRELRELTEDDLSKALDAMYAMWAYSEEEGQEKYGSNFHDANYFSEAHNFNAAWRDADHIHEGLGFLPQHLKITNIYETSMQSVDPSVSLFYWDFTIETKNGLTIFESDYFQENTFGSLSRANSSDLGWTYELDQIDDARILDGRWAEIKTEAMTKYPELKNGYGYMRGPWNMNPSKYVTRFAAEFPDLPGCGNYKDWIEESDFETFNKIAPYGPHSTTHSGIGGVFGCDILNTFRKKGMIESVDKQLDICQKWGFYIKELYRGNYITPKTNCTYEKMDCGFDCNDELSEEMLDMLKDTINLSSYLPSNVSDSDWTQWKDFICEGGAYKIFVGDHLESASPSDPSFWPIHPTMERLLHAKYMSGGFDAFDWPTSAKKNYVCNHAECYENDVDEKDYYQDCCYGHFEYDQLLDFVNGNKSAGTGPTNRETLDATDASSSSYSMPYIYSDFSWSHCDEDFPTIIEKLAESRRRL